MRAAALTALAFAVLMSACVLADEQALADLVKPVPRSEGAPRQDDICFSSRWPRPMSASDPHDTLEAMDRFHATRLDWCYTGTDEAFIQKIKDSDRPVFGTINTELPDAPGKSTRVRGRDRTRTGAMVPNPALKAIVPRGDVASDAYRDVVMTHCRAMLDAGVEGIQADDPGMTYYGALHADAGYGEASVAGFLAYLEQETKLDQRVAWGLPADLTDFDYRAFAESRDEQMPEALRKQFFAFHRQSLNDFYTWLRPALDSYAGRRVPLSCNNGSNQRQIDFPYVEHFDFWVGETGLQYGDPTAKGIFGKSINAQRLGMVQVYSPPNDGLDRIPTRDAYVDLTRKIIATGYACGSPVVVPWDVWRRGPDTPRFFGTRAEFGDLYDLVHGHRGLFKDYELAFAAGPGITAWRVDGLETTPVDVTGNAFVAVRALPGTPDGPVVIHVVDWRETPGPVRVTLTGRLAGHRLTVVHPSHEDADGAANTGARGKITVRPRPWALLKAAM